MEKFDKFAVSEKEEITYEECQKLRLHGYNFLFVEFIDENKSIYKIFKTNNYIKNIIIAF